MLAVALIVISDLTRAGYGPVAYSVIVNHTPVMLRGSMTSIMQLTTILFSFGVGPLVVGVLSDLFGGGAALRYAIAALLGVSAVVALLMLGGICLLRSPADETGPSGGLSGEEARPS